MHCIEVHHIDELSPQNHPEIGCIIIIILLMRKHSLTDDSIPKTAAEKW